MSDEYGPNFLTITDEDGNDIELEHVDTLEYNGQVYMAFFPAGEGTGPDDEDYGLIILKVVHEGGEDLFSTPDSDEELQAVYDQFMEELFSEDAENSTDESDDDA